MRRSLLFIPANSPAMLQNADVFDADAIIFDLEDSVILEEKDAARNLLFQYLNHFKDLNMEKIVRINGVDTIFFEDDLKLIMKSGIDTIMLPKATLETTQFLSKKLNDYHKKFKMKKEIRILPIIELAISLIQVNEIAQVPLVNGLLLGAEDFATNIEVQRTKSSDEILFARHLVILAAKAFKLDAIDTPYTDKEDDEGLLKDASFARSIGMNAKACIHPNQIEIINRIFSPSIEDINYAKKVLLAYDVAKKENRGAFSVDGKMIDKPIIDRSIHVIEKAKKFNLL